MVALQKKKSYFMLTPYDRLNFMSFNILFGPPFSPGEKNKKNTEIRNHSNKYSTSQGQAVVQVSQPVA